MKNLLGTVSHSVLAAAAFTMVNTTGGLPQAQAQSARTVLVKSQIPGLGAKVEIRNTEYDQEVHVDLGEQIDFSAIRTKVLDGTITKEVSEWVKDAQYSKPDTHGDYGYKLSIGKAMLVFTHSFKCRETVGETWIQECSQVAGDGKEVVHGAYNTVECTNATGSTNCLFRMRGAASPIKVPFVGKIEAGTMAGKLFVENVSYVAHVGLLLTGASTVAAAKKEFSKSAYVEMVTGLQARLDQELERSSIVTVQAALGMNFDGATRLSARLGERRDGVTPAYGAAVAGAPASVGTGSFDSFFDESGVLTRSMFELVGGR